MKRFLTAVQFLTVLPIRIRSEITEEDLGGSLLYFPVAGMLIGLLLSAAAILFNFLPDPVAGALVLTASVVITGGIHLDGFADTCDGFCAPRSGQEILKIMRDSRIGVMGVLGIVCLLLIKFTLIISVQRDILWKVLVVMAVFARWSQVLACSMSSYARREGKAKWFIEYDSRKELFVGSLLTAALSTLLLHLTGVILLAASLPPVLILIHYLKSRIDGMTGDTVGAVSEVAEVSVLLSCLLSGGVIM